MMMNGDDASERVFLVYRMGRNEIEAQRMDS